MQDGTATVPALLPAVILISGKGSNMRVLAEHALQQTLPIQLRAVISDRHGAEGLKTAAGLGIATAVVPAAEFADRAAFDNSLAEVIEGHQPGVVILAGFMRILGPAFIERFTGRMLNIHPSLLPLHRGLHTHRRVLQAGECRHGASVHFVTQELDGGPVIIQGALAVHPQDTETTLSARVQRVEHRIYPQALLWLATGRLQWNESRVRLDGAELAHPVVIEDTE
jgi:phosphoribosylglycinamide formyltransferase-1